MNSKFIVSSLIAAASLVSVNVFAAGADGAVQVQPSLVSTLTRAQVRADALTIKHGPVIASNQVDGGTTVAATPAAIQRSRNEVRSEAAGAGAKSSVLKSTAPGRA